MADHNFWPPSEGDWQEAATNPGMVFDLDPEHHPIIEGDAQEALHTDMGFDPNPANHPVNEGDGQEAFNFEMGLDFDIANYLYPTEGDIDNGMANWDQLNAGLPLQTPNQSELPALNGVGSWPMGQSGALPVGQQIPPEPQPEALPLSSWHGLTMPAVPCNDMGSAVPCFDSRQSMQAEPFNGAAPQMGPSDPGPSTLTGASYSMAPQPPLESLQQPGPSGSQVLEGDNGFSKNPGLQAPSLQLNDEPVGESRNSSVPREGSLRDPNWTYAVEVYPAQDKGGEIFVRNHISSLAKIFKRLNLEYRLVLDRSVEGPDLCRQYRLPQKNRFDDKIRLDFLQVFNATRKYNEDLPGYSFRMSVVYDDQSILPSGSYPSGIDGNGQEGDAVRYSPVPALHEYVPLDGTDNGGLLPNTSAGLASPSILGPLTPDSLAPPAKAKNRPAIPKPQREETRDENGRWVCRAPDCDGPVRTFARRCEWNKHMDRHDRPYHCSARECVNIAGFTYVGGLLRHEREVHGQHGGPSNSLNCPHGNCKRHEGKGFARMENLNEHLRRIHTPNDARSLPPTASPEDDVEDASATLQVAGPSAKVAGKRKADSDLREENKRLKLENQSLCASNAGYTRQSMAIMQEMEKMKARISELEALVANAPPPA
ncbi:hypothetical protein F4804DRAFT_338139 [Jackrogersella minutella]|nr:hypothetical protein F4804DRAFT_338139 [Jackrogersella minutella]